MSHVINCMSNTALNQEGTRCECADGWADSHPIVDGNRCTRKIESSTEPYTNRPKSDDCEDEDSTDICKYIFVALFALLISILIFRITR